MLATWSAGNGQGAWLPASDYLGIWDKRAVAYERALAELANRRVRRERAIYLPNDTMTPTDTMTAAKRLETCTI